MILCVFGMISMSYQSFLLKPLRCTELCPLSLFILTTSIRQGVPGEESEWSWCREAVCHEGFEEGHYCTKGKDCWTHTDGAASAGAHPPVSIPRHTSLRLPDGYQAAPHSGLGCFVGNCFPYAADCVLCLYKQKKRLMIVFNPVKEMDFHQLNELV